MSSNRARDRGLGNVPVETWQREIIFYDGHCGLCHAAVRFVVARDDREEGFVFAPLGGETFRETLLLPIAGQTGCTHRCRQD